MDQINDDARGKSVGLRYRISKDIKTVFLEINYEVRNEEIRRWPRGQRSRISHTLREYSRLCLENQQRSLATLMEIQRQQQTIIDNQNRQIDSHDRLVVATIFK